MAGCGGYGVVVGAELIIPVERIENRILLIRNKRVMIDVDLAELFGVSTKRLNEQVKRNGGRFPDDFMFRLTEQEKEEVVANCDHLGKLKYSKALPCVFTEHGAIMASNVLNSPRAIEMGIYIVRAFVSLRRVVLDHRAMGRKLDILEKKLVMHDEQLVSIVRVIKSFITKKEIPEKRRIGFESLQAITPRIPTDSNSSA